MAAGPSIEHSTMRTPASGWALAMAGDSSGTWTTPSEPDRHLQRIATTGDDTDMLTPVEDLDAYLATRAAWHTLAERVLAPARQAASGRIGLRPAPGGFATPEFGAGRALAVEGTEVVVVAGSTTRRRAITTLGDAAEFAGVAPDADTGVYPATTPEDPDTELAVDPSAATVLAAWFAFGDAVLGAWAAGHPDDSPSPVQLWPEHFDLGTDLGPESGRANYGASPGDAGHQLPYLYAGPWATSDDPFWNAGAFARLDYETLLGVDDPAAAAATFFGEAYAVAMSAKS